MKKTYEINNYLASTFDLVAKDFERVGPAYFTYFGHQLINRSGLEKGKHVLDVACGRGASLFKAYEVTGLSGRLVGVDFSKKMIARLKETSNRKGIDQLEAYQMEAEDLLFDNKTFDYVFCGLAIHFFSNPVLSLEEMHRVLRVGGRLGITSWGIQKQAVKKGVYERAYDKVFSNKNRQARSVKKQIDFSSEEGLIKLLSSIGFSDIEVKKESKLFYYESKDAWWTEQSNNATGDSLKELKRIIQIYLMNLKELHLKK